jgi:hypothetical protein
MPEIEITPEQQERLRDLQEEIARDVVGKYGHVRPRDAVEYLLDRYEADEDADPGGGPAVEEGSADASAGAGAVDDAGSAEGNGVASGDGDGNEDTDAGADANGATARVVEDASDGDGGGTGGDDAMLNEMMSLLETHDDKWGESSGDERYEVELPDGSSEQVRTKDDVKALLFKHYR